MSIQPLIQTVLPGAAVAAAAVAVVKYITKLYDVASLKYPAPVSIRAMQVSDVKKRTRVNLEKGTMNMAYERDDGVIGQVSIKSPVLRVVHSGSLCGTGGQAKLKDDKLADKKFSLVCTDLDLIHPEIYEANASLDIRGNTGKFNAILEEFYAIFIDVKAENPTVHVKQYEKAKKFADMVAMANPGQTMDKYLTMLIMQLQQLATKAFHANSAEVEKALGMKGAYDYKFTATPFFKPKKAEKVHPVDPEIKVIFEKGPVEGNPDYKFAAEVMDQHKKGLNFNRMRVTHVNKNIKYPPFGPFFGRNSSITLDFEIMPYESGDNDGLNMYIKGILVLKDEPYVPHDKETTSEFIAPPNPVVVEAAGGGGGGGGGEGEPDAKRQKMDDSGATTTDFNAGATK
jgi:hypothetical protein